MNKTFIINHQCGNDKFIDRGRSGYATLPHEQDIRNAEARRKREAQAEMEVAASESKEVWEL